MPARGQFVATVIDNEPLCREHFRLVLRVDQFPPTEPGQFIQIACRDAGVNPDPQAEFDWPPVDVGSVEGEEFRHPVALLRRPFSLAGRRDTPEGVELDIIHRVVGTGTCWMSQLDAGNTVDILGPLGNRFELPRNDQIALLVGGGVGIPPMLYLAERVAGRAVAFCGATSRQLLPLKLIGGAQSGASEPDFVIDEFARHQIKSIITTDDGSYGLRGFVTDALERYLESLTPQSSTLNPVIYTCGPELMMKRVAEIAIARGIECQVAVERAMACGMGTCQSCCIRVRKPDVSQVPLPGSDWCYRLACTDGPVFPAADLLW